MPIVQINLLKGRDKETKKKIVEAVTKALIETANATPESIRIIISDMELDNYSIGGELMSDIRAKK